MAIAVDALGKLSTVLSALRGQPTYAAAPVTSGQARIAPREPAYSVTGGGRPATSDEVDDEWRYWWSRSVSF